MSLAAPSEAFSGEAFSGEAFSGVVMGPSLPPGHCPVTVFEYISEMHAWDRVRAAASN